MYDKIHKYITDVVMIEPLGEVKGLQRFCVAPKKAVAEVWSGGGCGQ